MDKCKFNTIQKNKQPCLIRFLILLWMSSEHFNHPLTFKGREYAMF